MSWKKIIIEDDPDWHEYHKEVITESCGRLTLKVIFDGFRYRGYTLRKSDGMHGALVPLNATSIDEAKENALKLIGAQ